MLQAYTIRPNADGTVTVKVGRAVEHISLASKEKGQIYDEVKYALVSKGVVVSNERLTKDLYDLIWRHTV